jgi:integrase
VFELWSRSQAAEYQYRTKKYLNGNVRRVELWALRYLGEHRIDLITASVLADYIEWRLAGREGPALSTLRNERTALNQVFLFARRKGFIRDLPILRIKPAKQTARPDIPEAEWQKLCDYMDAYVVTAQDRRRHRERFYLTRYILILANTGIRVGEARKLRWQDISETRTLTGESRVVLTVRGKTGEREVVCNAGVEAYLRDLAGIRSQEVKGEVPLHEHVFCLRDGRPVGSFKNGFTRILREAGVLFTSDRKKRVPYSLRHTYATMRISEGVNVFQLAANMGTSVEMIEQFYGKKRVRDPKMATEITKGSASINLLNFTR